MSTIEQYQQLGFKTESVEFTPETLAAADYAIAWHDNTKVVPMDEINERRLRRASLAPNRPVGGSYLADISGTFEPAPSGVDGTAPKWFDLLKGCGATVTTDVATWGAQDTGYTAKGSPLTFVHRDGQFARTASGARIETLVFKANRGELWLCEMTAKGRYSQATDLVFESPSLPLVGQPFLGHAVTVGGVARPVSSIEIAITNTLVATQDGTHDSGNGRMVITEQRITFKASVEDDGTNWFDKIRNDSSGDLLAVSAQMAKGAAGSVLTWTGSIALMEDPNPEFTDGIGYIPVSGEFVATGTGAICTLTQS